MLIFFLFLSFLLLVGFDVFRMKCCAYVQVIGWLFKFQNGALLRCLWVCVRLAGWNLSWRGAPASLFHHLWGALSVFYLRLVTSPRDFSNCLPSARRVGQSGCQHLGGTGEKRRLVEPLHPTWKYPCHPPFSPVASPYCAWCPSFCRVTEAAGWLHRGSKQV